VADSALLPAVEAEALSVELSEEVLTVLAPDELPFLSDAVRDFRDGRIPEPGSKTRDEPLGFGIELSLLAPYVLAVMPSVINFLAGIFAESAKEEAATALGSLIRRLLRRRDAAAETSVRLTAEQGRRVRSVTYERAMTVGLDKKRAALLADAVVGSLSVAGPDER
jgi:hypothetical protein